MPVTDRKGERGVREVLRKKGRKAARAEMTYHGSNVSSCGREEKGERKRERKDGGTVEGQKGKVRDGEGEGEQKKKHVVSLSLSVLYFKTIFGRLAVLSFVTLSRILLMYTVCVAFEKMAA